MSTAQRFSIAGATILIASLLVLPDIRNILNDTGMAAVQAIDGMLISVGLYF